MFSLSLLIFTIVIRNLLQPRTASRVTIPISSALLPSHNTRYDGYIELPSQCLLPTIPPGDTINPSPRLSINAPTHRPHPHRGMVTTYATAGHPPKGAVEPKTGATTQSDRGCTDRCGETNTFVELEGCQGATYKGWHPPGMGHHGTRGACGGWGSCGSIDLTLPPSQHEQTNQFKGWPGVHLPQHS